MIWLTGLVETVVATAVSEPEPERVAVAGTVGAIPLIASDTAVHSRAAIVLLKFAVRAGCAPTEAATQSTATPSHWPGATSMISVIVGVAAPPTTTKFPVVAAMLSE